MGDSGWCVACKDEPATTYHRQTKQHRFNFLLYSYNKYRKYYGKDKNNVVIEVTGKNIAKNIPLKVETSHHGGMFSIELTEEEAERQTDGITFIIKVKPEKSIILLNIFLLYPKEGINFYDVTNIISQNCPCQIGTEVPYTVKLTFKAFRVGEYVTALAFEFKDLKDHDKEFYIIKDMEVKIENEFKSNQPLERTKSHFTAKQWGNVTIEPPEGQMLPYYKYPIPPHANVALTTALRKKSNMPAHDKHTIDSISHCLNSLSRGNYKEFFHYILWLDEIGAELKISKYNMEEVTVKYIENKGFIELEVAGLAEKRPSVLRGDFVYFRFHNSPVSYTGKVHQVREKDIWIERLAQELIEGLLANPKAMLDVRFEISRLQYERMHRAVDLCSVKRILDILFPNVDINANRNNSLELADSQYANKKMLTNAEQKLAVSNILNRTSGKAPYIVFGPPGTGKTVTIVEAIYQIVINIPKSRVLVTAPTNAACDMIVVNLSKYFSKSDMIRIHSETVDWQTVPKEALAYSNKTSITYLQVQDAQLLQFRIVVTTLMSAGRYANSAYKATHVFIDEAAQAMEPESLISIGGILSENGQLVLAGDPKQLGPLSNSIKSAEYGIEQSLLARLMKLPIYSITSSDAHYFITKLLLNYRNNPVILKLPNDFFYDSELKPTVSEHADPISHIILPVDKTKGIVGRPMEFYSVITKESKQGKAPSYYNKLEVQVVLKYIKALLDCQVPVKPEEIGVITPYMRQVSHIRNEIKNRNYPPVEVGTTETFQGREKRIIILSTVRGQKSFLLTDDKYNIGFVKNAQRFNVAITRAKSKLIVVGNPICLCTNDKWLSLIHYCKSLNSYRGEYFTGRDDAFKDEVIKNLNRIKNINLNN